jgi:glutamine synthetase
MTSAGDLPATERRPGLTAAGNAANDAVTRAVTQARADKLALVRFLYADHGGIIRGKSVSVDRLPARMASGIGHTVAMMAMSMLDDLQPVEGMGPVGEVRIVPDPDTFVSLPYAPGAGAMLADLVRPGGEPWEACARTFLKQAIAALAAEGYGLAAAFEPEFTLGRREASPGGAPDRLLPVDDSLCYSATGFHLAHDYTMELFAALQAQDLRVEHYYPELATASRRYRSGTRRRCGPPTTTSCTGRPCARWRSAAACGPAWRPSPFPGRPATAPICTAR